jgi:hypothetical protein
MGLLASIPYGKLRALASLGTTITRWGAVHFSQPSQGDRMGRALWFGGCMAFQLLRGSFPICPVDRQIFHHVGAAGLNAIFNLMRCHSDGHPRVRKCEGKSMVRGETASLRPPFLCFHVQDMMAIRPEPPPARPPVSREGNRVIGS